MDVFGDEELARLHGEWNNIDESIDNVSIGITVTVTIIITSIGSVEIIVANSYNPLRS